MKLNRLQRFWRSALRVASWRLITALHIDAFHKIPGAKFSMYLEPRFRSVGSLAVYSLGLWYEEALTLLPALLGPADGFIDCGASQGVFALYASQLVGPHGRVIAVEPQSYATRAIRLSAAANDFQQLWVREAAVSDQDGQALLGIGDEPVAASLMKPEAENSTLVETVRLDSLLPEFGERRVKAIKLDVEGAEELALRGAERLLSEHRPHVIFECYNANDQAAIGAYDRLSQKGYEFFLPEHGKLLALNGERRESFNILAVHPSRRATVASLIDRQPNRADLEGRSPHRRAA